MIRVRVPFAVLPMCGFVNLACAVAAAVAGSDFYTLGFGVCALAWFCAATYMGRR